MLAGCSNDLEPINVINVSEQFELKLHQILSSEGGLPAIQINSIETNDCENAFISHQVVISDDLIQVFLNDVRVEGNCEPGGEIVSEEILVSNPYQSIPIEIILKNAITNQSTLHSNSSGFEIVFEQFDALKVSRTRLNRIRPGMLWGSYTITNESVREELIAYLDFIENKNVKVQGDYGHFYLSQDNSVVIQSQDEINDFTFLVTTEEDLADFENNMRFFKELAPSLVLSATNYDGNSVNIP